AIRGPEMQLGKQKVGEAELPVAAPYQGPSHDKQPNAAARTDQPEVGQPGHEPPRRFSRSADRHGNLLDVLVLRYVFGPQGRGWEKRRLHSPLYPPSINAMTSVIPQ